MNEVVQSWNKSFDLYCFLRVLLVLWHPYCLSLTAPELQYFCANMQSLYSVECIYLLLKTFLPTPIQVVQLFTAGVCGWNMPLSVEEKNVNKASKMSVWASSISMTHEHVWTEEKDSFKCWVCYTSIRILLNFVNQVDGWSSEQKNKEQSAAPLS